MLLIPFEGLGQVLEVPPAPRKACRTASPAMAQDAAASSSLTLSRNRGNYCIGSITGVICFLHFEILLVPILGFLSQLT